MQVFDETRPVAGGPLDHNYSQGRRCKRCRRPICNTTVSGLCLEHSREYRMAQLTKAVHDRFHGSDGTPVARKPTAEERLRARQAASAKAGRASALARWRRDHAPAPAAAPAVKAERRGWKVQLQALPPVAELPESYLVAAVNEARRRRDRGVAEAQARADRLLFDARAFAAKLDEALALVGGVVAPAVGA